MPKSNIPIKLILGIKLKQFRQNKSLSIKELSERTKISHSYLNEIEKGKKYPKPEKLLTIAKALDINYDQLVSVNLDFHLDAVAGFFQSTFFDEFPFDFFEIDAAQLIESVTRSPLKFDALIKTLTKMSRGYNIGYEKLYSDVLYSYVESHQNYFPEIEKAAGQIQTEISEPALKKFLKNQLGIATELFSSERHPALKNTKYIYLPKYKKLLINRDLHAHQRLFYLAKEIGNQVLNMKPRFLSSPNLVHKDFNENFNDFMASYFAASLLIQQQKLINELQSFFNRKVFSKTEFFRLADTFQVNVETLFFRILTVLSNHFGISDLYMIKFEFAAGTREPRILREMRLSKKRPYGINNMEHPCRRWLGVSILNEIDSGEKKLKTQISNFVGENSQYFEISVLQKQFNGRYETITFSIGINDQSRSLIKFLDHSKINTKTVGHTCETCPIFDCKERVAAPTVLSRYRDIAEVGKAIRELR